MKHFIILIMSAFFSVNVVMADTEKAEDQASYFLRHLENRNVVKCGTPLLLNLLRGDTANKTSFNANLYATLSRPEMDAYKDSDKGHFRVHYDLAGTDAPDLTDTDLNGVPDYVDSALVYLEYAWKIIVVDLGYGPPKFDGTKGGSRDVVDCYMKELSPEKNYGYTSPDDNGSGSSYILIDNDFSEAIYPTKGYDALKVTTAHEFFHVIHYTYYGGSDAIWWMEQSAVWLEDRAWDDVDDYINYLYLLFDERDLPLDSSNGSFMYGATLFAFHIAQKYGEDTIRLIWNELRDRQNGKIENFNAVLPEGVSRAISDLAVWMYFTGSRANPDNFFSEADIIQNTITPDHILSDTTSVGSLSFSNYTFKYVEIIPEEGFAYSDSLNFKFENPDEGIWKNQVILYSSPKNYHIMLVPGDTPSVFIPRPFDKAILVIANTSQINKKYNYGYIIDIITSKGVKNKPAPAPFALHQNYPNPFNNSTTIPFFIHDTSHVTLKIMNINGTTVATLVDDFLPAGSYRETFEGSGLSSGVYFVVLESEARTLTQKMSLVK